MPGPDLARRLKNGRSILFDKQDPELAMLMAELSRQSHLTVVLWAFTCLRQALEIIQQTYPEDLRAGQCVDTAMKWARGEIKMPAARKAILALHSMAKEVQSAKDAALCHAVAQACSSVHTPGHAIGLAIYELTALVHEHGAAQAKAVIDARIVYYEKVLAQVASEEKPGPWAVFLRP